VAHNLKRRAAGKPFKSYLAIQPITVIPAGPHWAVVQGRHLRLKGFLGWLVREAADIIGFHDLEPWPKAARQFLTEFTADDDCETCSVTTAK
jgi:NADH dehydrogenase FAD-containing subunit